MSDFAILSGTDHWLRVSHQNTSLDLQTGIVQLAGQHKPIHQAAPQLISPAGLAFDPWCRVYLSEPEKNQVSRLLWHQKNQPQSRKPVFATADPSYGDFAAQYGTDALGAPRGLAIDNKGRLFIADQSNRRILIFDLLDKTLIRTLNFTAAPGALSTDGERVYAVLTDSAGHTELMVFDAHSQVQPVEVAELPEGQQINIGDVAVDPNGQVVILHDARQDSALLWPVGGQHQPIAVAYGSAIVFTASNELVVARSPNADFLRFRISARQVAELPHLQARHYDGRGITRDPTGRVAYWSHKGIMFAAPARINFVNEGRLVGFRLDNGQIQRRWGRIYIDACLPAGTQLKVGFVVADELSQAPSIIAQPPQNVAEFELHRPDLSPPLPTQTMLNTVNVEQAFHRRSQNRELPWSFTDEPWRTYEAPVNAPPGRYLWLVIELYGKSHASPKIKQVRVEYPAIDLLRHLPRIFSQQGSASDFLYRYLSLLHSNFDELDKRASKRQMLLDPMATPSAVLPWLSSLLGMQLDQRWSEAATRQILQQAMWLYQFRGTVTGIKSFIEIYLQREIHLIEHFKVRGLGGVFVGQNEDLASSAILGAGFRIGGRIGDEQDLTGTPTLVAQQGGTAISFIDSITQHAHRFSVIVPLILTTEQRAVIEHILEVHRPAHTLFDICAVDTGMRLGTGLHLGLTSVIGSSSGFGELQLGKSLLGRSDLLGTANSGMQVGNSHSDFDSRVG